MIKKIEEFLDWMWPPLPVLKVLPEHVRNLKLDVGLIHLGQIWANDNLGNPAVNKKPTLPKELP